MDFIDAMRLKDELRLTGLYDRIKEQEEKITAVRVHLDDVQKRLLLDAQSKGLYSKVYSEPDVSVHTENKLTPLVCSCCGGRVNSETLTCDFCGTAFTIGTVRHVDPLANSRRF